MPEATREKVESRVSCDYLKWLCYTHNGAHVVAIVTQDKVSWAFRQFLLSKGYLEKHYSDIYQMWMKIISEEDETHIYEYYHMLLPMKICFLLLGPHISHVVLVVLETHLKNVGSSSNIINNTLKFLTHLTSLTCFFSETEGTEVSLLLPYTVQSNPKSCEQSWVPV